MGPGLAGPRIAGPGPDGSSTRSVFLTISPFMARALEAWLALSKSNFGFTAFEASFRPAS